MTRYMHAHTHIYFDLMIYSLTHTEVEVGWNSNHVKIYIHLIFEFMYCKIYF